MVIHKKQPQRMLLASFLTGCFLLLQAVAVLAIANGYATDDNEIQPGMTVSLGDGNYPDDPKVVRAYSGDGSDPIGVTVDPNENLVTTGGEGKRVYVQANGEVDAFVSDLNGVPKQGDILSTSPLKGVLVIADGNSSRVVGTALEDFSQKDSIAQAVERAGAPTIASIDKMRISLDQKSQEVQAESESALERLGRSIAGKNVSDIRVVIALIIFLVVLVAEGSIIYGAVTSAVIAIGRNPMAGKIVSRELVRVVFIALAVLTFGLTAIYAILNI